MTQPFDNRDWDVRQIAELEAEIARVKALLARAADALGNANPGWKEFHAGLIAELRKAAQ